MTAAAARPVASERSSGRSGLDRTVTADERSYWLNEVRCRSTDLAARQARGDAPYLVAGARLRLREAEERLERIDAGDAPSLRS